MTARLKKTVANCGLALLAFLSACTSYTEIPIETPISPKLDVSPFQRIFIAGFIAVANEDVDANMETVRLLRSQLRNKGIMRVIDADTLPLLEVARQNAAETNGEPAPDQQPGQPPQDQDKPPVFNDEKDLEPYQHLFANVAYWKRIGEEYQQPLIVTGAILFAPQQRSGFVQRETETYDPFGLLEPKDFAAYRSSSNNPNLESNDDSKRPIPGETTVLADLEGPGVVTHLWITVAASEYGWPRLLRFRVYYDGSDVPSVDVPLGDFFGSGHGFEAHVQSAVVRVSSEGRSRNAFWPMPFRKSCRITITNEGHETVRLLNLGPKLLDAVLTKIALSGGIGGGNGLDWMGLAHGYQRNITRTPARTLRGRVDALPHPC